MLKQIIRAFQGKGHGNAGTRLYRDLIDPSLMAQALKICALPDTFSARFDTLALLVAQKLPQMEDATVVERDLIGALVKDIDQSFRERSLGDATVRKHAKNHAAAFYGRLRAYGTMTGAGEAAVLSRNLYGDAPSPQQQAALPMILPEIRKLLGACPDG